MESFFIKNFYVEACNVAALYFCVGALYLEASYVEDFFVEAAYRGPPPLCIAFSGPFFLPSTDRFGHFHCGIGSLRYQRLAVIGCSLSSTDR